MVRTHLIHGLAACRTEYYKVKAGKTEKELGRHREPNLNELAYNRGSIRTLLIEKIGVDV